MKRMSLAGLCLVAVFALSALVASAAQAAEPEWAGCIAKKKGEYTNSSCTTKSAKAHKGAYEFVAGQAATCIAQKDGEYASSTCTTKSKKPHKGKYEVAPAARFTSTGGAGILKSELHDCLTAEFEEQKRTGDCKKEEGHTENEPFRANVECKSESSSGEAFGADGLRNIKVLFKGCLALGVLACSNTAHAEEIEVNTLDGSLGYINKAQHEVGVLLEPKVTDGPFAEFQCEGLNFVVGAAQPTESSRFYSKLPEPVESWYTPNGGDGIISPITPVNTLTDEFKQVYSTTEDGENIPDKFENGPLKALEVYSWNPEGFEGTWSPAGEEIENTNHLGGYAEIKA